MNKKIKLSKVLSLIVIMGLVVLLGWQVFVFSGIENIVNMTNNAFDNSNLNIASLFTGKTEVLGKKEGRTNVLLFGINELDGNGEGTVDSNIILSYYHNINKVSTVSFMRDLIVDDSMKLNAIYPSLGQSKNQNKEYQDYITKLTGLPIHYTVKINMQATTQLIDKIGGVTVDVPNTFRDLNYPKLNDYSIKYCPDRQTRDDYMCPTPQFNKGKVTMDGAQALIFARSRKGQCQNEITKQWNDLGCVENGDDARGKRQQLIIQSIVQKLKDDVQSKRIVLDPKYISGIFDVLGTNVQTSLNVAEAMTLVLLIKDNVNIADMKKITLSYQDTLYKKDSLLLCSSGASDILLCDGTAFTTNNLGNYALRLRQIIQNQLEESDELLPLQIPLQVTPKKIEKKN
jgi:anionic cell wall polymer biosynthesis LytR-Cps2A-Psr (LCP) family protein